MIQENVQIVIMESNYLNTILEKIQRKKRIQCRDCIKLINKEYRTMNKDEIKMQRKEYFEKRKKT